MLYYFSLRPKVVLFLLIYTVNFEKLHKENWQKQRNPKTSVNGCYRSHKSYFTTSRTLFRCHKEHQSQLLWFLSSFFVSPVFICIRKLHEKFKKKETKKLLRENYDEKNIYLTRKKWMNNMSPFTLPQSPPRSPLDWKSKFKRSHTLVTFFFSLAGFFYCCFYVSWIFQFMYV